MRKPPRYDASLLAIAQAAASRSQVRADAKPRQASTPWEHREHALLVQRLDLDPFWRDVQWWATPNQGKRSKAEQGARKREGMKAGVPDLQFMLPLHGYHGLFVELKADPPHEYAISKAQRERTSALARAGYAVVIARGSFAGWDAIEAYRRGTLRDQRSGVGGFWWTVPG